MTRVAAAVGWALLHSAWSGALLLICVQLLRHAVTDPASRHRLAALALFSLPIVTAGAALWLLDAWTAAASWTLAPASGNAAAAPERSFDSGRVAMAITALWLAGAAIALRRPWRAWREARALRRGAMGSVPATTLRDAAELSRALGIHRVPVLTSAAVDVPTVVGVRRPVVLLPSAAIGALPDAQSRSILAHELGHVARRDCLLATLQLACETLFWFHPSARRLGRMMALERELACDDLAVQACGSAREHAGALARLEEMRQVMAPALAANGGVLVARIRRLVAPAGTPSRIAGAAACTTVMMLLGSGALATSLAAQMHQRGAGRPRDWRFAGPVAIRAEDPAGKFAVFMRQGRVTGASLGGRTVESRQLIQQGDTLLILDEGGRAVVSVRVKPAGGLSWAPRPVRPPS